MKADTLNHQDRRPAAAHISDQPAATMFDAESCALALSFSRRHESFTLYAKPHQCRTFQRNRRDGPPQIFVPLRRLHRWFATLSFSALALLDPRLHRFST